MASTITIVQQPVSTTFNLKSHTEDVAAVSFNTLATAVTADGPQAGSPVAVTYQWQRSTNGGASFSNVGGATSAVLNFDAPVTATGYGYRAVVSAQGSSNVTTVSAVLTVDNQYAQFATDTEAGSARFGRLWAAEIV